ncbi:hydrogenase large subunit, partial [Candidatus Hakubella thermalkaliphila]
DRHPWKEDTVPKYTDFQADKKYSWVKAPTFKGEPAQVGPLANVLCMYAAGHEPTRKYVHKMLEMDDMVMGCVRTHYQISDILRI